MLFEQNLSDRRVTNISKSFTHKMAAKTSWHRYGTKLRHCHPVYSTSTRLAIRPSVRRVSLSLSHYYATAAVGRQ